MMPWPPDADELAFAERFLGPAADLVHSELMEGACPFRIAILLQCLATAAVRFDQPAEDDFAALLAQAMREMAVDLMTSDLLTSREPLS